MPYKFILASLCLTLLLAFTALSAFYLSLWHMWAILPAGEMKIAVDRSQPAALLIEPYLFSQFPDLSFLSQTRKYVISGTPGNYIVAALPRHPFAYQQLINDTGSQGWQVTSRWPILVARQLNEKAANTFTEAYLESLKFHFSSSVPIRPFAIGYLSASLNPILDSDIYYVAAQAKPASTSPAIGLEVNTSGLKYTPLAGGQISQDNSLLVAMPSRVLDVLPPLVVKVYLGHILKSLPYQRVNPDLPSALRQQQAFAFHQDGGSIALSVLGNPAAFRQQVKEWTIKEESYSRPQSETIQLPDKTLIKSYTASTNENIFKTAGNCEAASWLAPATAVPGDNIQPKETKRSEIWLCQEKERQITLSSSQALAKTSAAIDIPEGNRWAARLNGEMLQALNLPVSDIQALGSEDNAFLYITLPNK